MAQSIRDRLAGVVLLLFAVVWIAGVFWTIPEVSGDARVGPRGFPFWMGMGLVGLSLILIAGSFVRTNGNISLVEVTKEKADARSEVWAAASAFGFLVVYILALDWLGFIPATVLVVAAFLWFVLGKRSPLLVAGLPVGLTLGIWYIMGKLMGVYLPKSDFIPLF
ncbi:MAG: tripartite tricarboxylate transporter TctB family protein [Rhizobiales bacterium]|nr:tripartite tricarboxylate transporter TctB family protein [Hyphomicrobiales bacterium]